MIHRVGSFCKRSISCNLFELLMYLRILRRRDNSTCRKIKQRMQVLERLIRHGSTQLNLAAFKNPQAHRRIHAQ